MTQPHFWKIVWFQKLCRRKNVYACKSWLASSGQVSLKWFLSLSIQYWRVYRYKMIKSVNQLINGNLKKNKIILVRLRSSPLIPSNDWNSFNKTIWWTALFTLPLTTISKSWFDKMLFSIWSESKLVGSATKTMNDRSARHWKIIYNK